MATRRQVITIIVDPSKEFSMTAEVTSGAPGGKLCETEIKALIGGIADPNQQYALKDDTKTVPNKLTVTR